MGDRYELVNMKCVYCNENNEEVYYAPTSGFDTFRCKHCKRYNFVCFREGFPLKKLEDVTYEDVENGFINTTSLSWSDDEVVRMCQGRLEEIKDESKRSHSDKRKK